MIEKYAKDYLVKFNNAFNLIEWKSVENLYNDIKHCWINKKNVFLCGNGGSAGNAIHVANDFVYGVAKDKGYGISAIALSSNQSVITCLANDISYDEIFSRQINVHGAEGDILIVFSGSGNSKNVLNAISEAKKNGIKTHVIVGYDGGEAKKMAHNSIHLPINDMQIAEDSQLLICHIVMQQLFADRVQVLG